MYNIFLKKRGIFNKRAFTLIEIIIGSVIAAFLAIVLIRILIFGTQSFSSGEAKLTNLSAAAMVTLRLKNDIHNMVSNQELDNTTLPLKIKIRQAAPDGDDEAVEATVKYEFTDKDNDPTTGISIKRTVMDGANSGAEKTYGNDNFESVVINKVTASNSAVGYRIIMKLSDNKGRATIDYDTVIFRRDTGNQGIKDNWIPFE